MTGHGASGPAAGYLYQCERALLELINRSSSPSVRLLLEAADDIEIRPAGQPSIALQVKHHLGAGQVLSDMSVDLWRSLTVWMDQLDSLLNGEVAWIGIVSTQACASDSGVAFLRLTGRDVAKAQTLLEAAARDSTNTQTKAARERFLGLDGTSRAQLVASVWVMAAEPQLADTDASIATALALHLSLAEGHREAFLESLKGWWYAQCVTMLTHPGSSISGADLAIYLQQLRDSFHPDNLPTSHDFPEPTIPELADYEESVFVKQLHLIAYTNEQLRLAIDAYHRAFTQRSRWTRQGLLYPGEIEAYERRLVEQWRLAFADVVAELGATAAEDARQKAGRGLLQRLRDGSSVRLRDRYDEVFMTHGSLHGLANVQRVGWHPAFEVRLTTLLAAAVP